MVYVIVAVPALTAVTTPLAFTVATPVLLLLHAPEPPPNTTPLAEYVAVPPIHNGLVPLTPLTAAFGVTVIVLLAQLVVTVHDVLSTLLT